ncbi:MAG TPA: hypothetical protein VM681_06530, partial [Candidatus Thermoplasmatota archaeon]|nr:hypothetical protein [Candidatus Thermoplasmatota archaeon]
MSDAGVAHEPRGNVQREVKEETEETVVLLDQERFPRARKIEQEAAAADASARVELEERSWHKTRPESLEEIERIVDAFSTGELAPPEGRRTEPRWRESRPAPPPEPLSEEDRRRIERHLGVEVTTATVLSRTPGAVVARVGYLKEGKGTETTVVLRDDAVRTLDDIGATLDAIEARVELPPKKAPAPKPPAARAKAPSALPAKSRVPF